MRILFIAESFPESKKIELSGGVEAGDYFVSQELSKKHQVMVLTGARESRPSCSRLGAVTIYRCGLAVSVTKREDLLVRLRFLYDAVRKSTSLEFDVVVGSNVFTQLIAIIISFFSKKPAVAMVADVYLGEWFKNSSISTALIGELLERLVLAYQWKNIMVWTNVVKSKLEKNHVKPDHIHVVGGGVNTELCFNLNNSKYPTPTLIMVGRLVSYKRHELVIRAMSKILLSVPNCQLLIVGSGSQKSELESLVTQLQLQKQVHFLGFISKYRDVLKEIKKSHLLVHASTVEGFGLVVLEALACGTPYAHTDLEVTREITQNGHGGEFLSDTPDGVAQTVLRLLMSKELYQEKVVQGLKLVRDYSWSEAARKREVVLCSAVYE